jgi:dTDP-4-dehydrorhamnose 3,5-epimerase
LNGKEKIMNFEFKKLAIPEVILITPEIFTDGRGFFMETYKKSVFEKAGIKENFIQDNCSRSEKNVLRGLHYQIPPMEQAKIVRCVKGEIFDVAVDIRKNSPRFGEWAGDYLSEKNKNMIFIPAGFAHGYLVLSEEAEIVYKVSKEYSGDHERGILWKDPAIGIEWPLSVEPILSEKDRKLPLLNEAENSFRYGHK